jgi:hypothetical protein
VSGPSSNAGSDSRAVLAKFHELSVPHVEDEHFTGFDFVDPTMQVQVASHQSGTDRRKRPQVFKLYQDILFDRGSQQTIPVKMAVVFTHNAAGRLGVR